MPPKKKDDGPKERPVLGRFKSHLKVLDILSPQLILYRLRHTSGSCSRFATDLQMGIVGLPNVGKSTLFNTLTKLTIPAENFPFCTIEPNNVRPPLPAYNLTRP